MTDTESKQTVSVLNEENASTVSLPVENYRPDDVPTYYADGTLVLHSGNEFVLSFMQTEFPLASSNAELTSVKAVRRKCVAQIIVSPNHFRLIVQALQKQLAKTNASHASEVTSEQ